MYNPQIVYFCMIFKLFKLITLLDFGDNLDHNADTGTL